MWEDNKTRSNWVFVNRCYFPNDLPEADGRPCSPESDEVYESNHGNTIVAGLIRGPCVVLPPSKFNEESGRRSRLGPGANDGLQPLYLCNDFICFNGVSSVLIMRHHISEAIHASEYESLTSLAEIVLLSRELRRIRSGSCPRFYATVNFNGDTFESSTFYSTFRLAEHAAVESSKQLANRGPC